MLRGVRTGSLLSHSLAGPTLFCFLNGAPLYARSQPSGFNEPQMRCFNDVVNIWPNIWRGRRSRGRADVRSAERAGQDWIRNMIFCPSENLAGRGLIRGGIMSRSRGAQSAPAACNARARILRASPGFVRRLGRYIICGIIIAPSIFWARDARQLPWIRTCTPRKFEFAEILKQRLRAGEKIYWFYLFSNVKRTNESVIVIKLKEY